jgi:hypothetical protein
VLPVGEVNQGGKKAPDFRWKLNYICKQSSKPLPFVNGLEWDSIILLIENVQRLFTHIGILAKIAR